MRGHDITFTPRCETETARHAGDLSFMISFVSENHAVFCDHMVWPNIWLGVYDGVFQFLLISSNFAQPLKRSGPTLPRPQSTA